MGEKPAETPSAAPQTSAAEPRPEAPPRETIRIVPPSTSAPAVPRIASRSPEITKDKTPPEHPARGNVAPEDPLHRLKKVFESLED